MLTAVILAAALAAGDDKDIHPLLRTTREMLEVPGKGEPEYTDAEAAAFATRLDTLHADRVRKPPRTLKDAVAELKLDPKKLRGGTGSIGNATDWAEYRISPSYTLSAAYTQGAHPEVAFRGIRIIKAEPVKPK